MPTPNAPTEQSASRFRADLLKCGCGPNHTYGVCVSGGADSLALLLLANATAIKIKAVTVDHRLRAESATEAQQVAAICAQLGVVHETLILGAPGGGNLSAWARTARYAALREWAAREGVEMLMTAHHADDQLETVLMRLNRGAGVAGLAGVRARQADLCRPLLGWRKAELVAVVEAYGMAAVDDPTNYEDAYDRARLRKHLAKVEWLDPRMAAISAAALAEANDALDWSAQGLLDKHLSHDGKTLILTLPPIPRELARRAVAACLLKLNPGAKPRGDALDRLLDALPHGKVATLAGIKCVGGTSWRFTVAAPRRTK
ncbi:MAG: tRNA lysidine(34) synthetase TilS [Pseudomonadota bacterium]